MKKRVKEILKSLEKTRLEYWNISPETGRFLNILIKTMEVKKVLEIGTSNGYSGLWMLDGLSKTNGHLWTMESHEKERFLLGKNTFEKAGFLNRVTQILGHAPEAIPSEKMSTKLFDLVFLDATKYEYPSYFDVIKNRVKKNGFVIADNANSHAKELKPYFKKVLSDKNWHSVKLDIGAGIMVSLKIL